MSINKYAIYDVIWLMYLSLLTIYVISLPSPLITFLSVLIMLVALSSILIGVKQHRDGALGGVIRFRTALAMGLGIALVASLALVAVF